MIQTIALSKGGENFAVQIETDDLNEAVFQEVVARGLRDLLEFGMSKVTKTNYPDQAEREGAAQALAAKNVENILSGDIRYNVTGAKKKKASGRREIVAEQKRLAKIKVREEMKRQGIKVSHVEAKEITRCMNILIDDPIKGPALWAQAEAEVERREREAIEDARESQGLGIEIHVSDKKVKQATEKAKRAKKGKATEDDEAPISATQAGMTFQTRKPGGVQPQARH